MPYQRDLPRAGVATPVADLFSTGLAARCSCVLSRRQRVHRPSNTGQQILEIFCCLTFTTSSSSVSKAENLDWARFDHFVCCLLLRAWSDSSSSRSSSAFTVASSTNVDRPTSSGSVDGRLNECRNMKCDRASEPRAATWVFIRVAAETKH